MIYSIKHILFALGMLLLQTNAWTQDSERVPFTIDQFLSIVIEHHPVAIQAQITADKGLAYITKARGGFDPKLYGSAYQKYFDGGQYYSQLGGGLKIPTWFGIELDAGYDIAQGDRLNPQAYTGKDGLWRVGISVPLGKNLFIDERRAALRQAKIYNESSLAQQQIILNDLLYDAAQAYWEWLKSYHKMKVYENAVQIAKTRFNGVVQSAKLGDKPFIDTLESSINLQSRQFNLAEYQLKYLNTKAGVDLFLWQDGYIPLEISDSIMPPLISDIAEARIDIPVLAMVDSLKRYHPELLKYQYDIEIAQVDLRLSAEQLKPTVNLKYNALNAPVNGNPWQDYNVNNYQWGAEVNFPIFLRKERGDLRLNKLELQTLEADLALKEASQTYKIWTYFNTWNTSIVQKEISERMISQYQSLYKGEQKLFDIGESSVFLLNSREKSLIEAELNLIDAAISNQKSKLSTEYALGILAL